MMTYRRFFKAILFLTNFLTTIFLSAQDLQRRAFLGIQMDTLSSKVRERHESTGNSGIVITNVLDGSTAAKAGFQKGDILIEFGGTTITMPLQMVNLVKTYMPGQQLEYKLLRNNKLIKKKLMISPLPEENYRGIKTVYSSVKSVVGDQRTILMEPLKEGKHPAILFIQGIGCYSIDSPFDTLRSENQLLAKLTRAGYITLRVEKSGMGDSKGKPCEEINLKEELAGYKAAFEYLQKQENVDKDNIFIIGHSMGGLMAPLLAKEVDIKGIIAYGTLGVNFLEYYVNSRRNISEAQQMNPAQSDDYIRQEGICIANYMTAIKNGSSEVTEPCSEIVEGFGFRSKEYWKQLFETNIPSLWMQYQGDVLAARGLSDFVSTKEEHEYIAEVVTRNGGKGTYVAILNADHGMNYAENYQQAIQNPGQFNSDVYTSFLTWLKEATNKI